MNKFASVLEGAKGGWNKIDSKKRMVMIMVVALVLLAIVVFAYSVNKVDYSVLFSNLELSDSGSIVSDLESRKIAYKLENNGKDILIDKALVDKYRIELAMNGMMPESSTGFEIFDDTGLMITDEDRQIMYQRALTGELQRSIMSLDAVNSAKVLLVMPEKSIFETQAKEASASVIIDIKPNYEISNVMIKGIAALVSGAVDNLPEGNIKIVDSKGNLLSGVLQNSELNAFDVMGQYQKVQNDFEKKLENNLLELLGSAFGINKIKVSVYADLDFDSEESTIISYENPVIRSEQVIIQGNIDTQAVTGGNIDDNISNVIGNGNNEGSSYDRTVNNELTTETKTTVKAPGKVNKITTSIVYDGNLSEANTTTIRNIVATATGYDINRGDLISVEGVEFDKGYVEGPSGEGSGEGSGQKILEGLFEKYGNYMIIGGLALLLALIIIGVIARKIISNKKKAKEKSLAEQQLAMDMVAMEKLEELNEEEEDDNIEVKPGIKERKAQNYAKENPDIAADLIKAWMKDM